MQKLRSQKKSEGCAGSRIYPRDLKARGGTVGKAPMKFCFERMAKKICPVLALALTSFFAFLLGVAGSITGSFAFEYLNKGGNQQSHIKRSALNGQPVVEDSSSRQSVN
ncbi:hypothetical protein [Lacimicrobium alkaliphilum]|uniref:hypothetical protein n=1 Tax=Lacimicrobium alkaliphilum TaxID=1526571 RepID=UPI0012E3CBA5|nr:hypothetical protein [Lacimicrobium alkaliphilum]